MAHTFDIRFVRSGGLAGLFEAPENSFRWKGNGRLSIDAQGMSLAVRRGLLSLLSRARTQRIPAADLRQVYREGEALCVEFVTGDRPREVVPFWAKDRETAAEIVKLLPTTRTVELEHSTVHRDDAKFRVDWRAVTLFGLALLLLAGGAAVLNRNAVTELALPPEIEVRPAIDATAENTAPAAVEIPAGTSPESFIQSFPVVVGPPPVLPGTRELADPADLSLRLPRNSPAYTAAREHVLAFARQAASIETSYRTQHRRFMSRDISTDEFVQQLDDCEMRWWDFTFRVLDNDALADPALADVRAALLGGARHWRNFYGGYAEGLRSNDHVMIGHSFDELTLAEELRARIRQYFYP